jgi:phospholipid/cholesterol/gamma-HCH transport system substrate-binding protein
METRANNALIGLFTLAVIGAALGFVVWFARLAEGTKVEKYQIVFSGSITGLSVGSSVLFNGIRVGQVDALDLLPEDPSRVVAIVTVKDSTPLKVDTRARMEFQGFTGGAYIQLYGGSAESPKLEPPPEQQMATIYAERSELQNLVDGARDTVTQAAQTLTRIDDFIRKNEGGLSQTVTNVQKFTGALADNSDNVSKFLQQTGDAAESIGRLSNSLNGMAGDVEALIKAVDPAKVETVVNNVTGASEQLQRFASGFDPEKARNTLNNVEQFSQALAEAKTPITNFTNDAAALASRLNTMAPKLEQSLDGLSKLTASIDPAKIGRVVDNVEAFTAVLGSNGPEVDAFIKDARKLSGDLAAMTPKLGDSFDNFNKVASAIDPQKIDRVVNNVDRFAATLGDSSDTVRGVVNDASELGKKLNASADRLDAILKNIDTMVQSPEGKGMFAEISDTAKAIRTLAQNLDARTGELSKNLNAFTGSGLRDYQNLAVDGQRTLRDIQRTLNSLNRNPQQLIFGPKNSIPDYKGQ